MPAQFELALSIKQPWATLVVHGFKQIEIRRWATTKRGRILIHTGRFADERAEAWTHVPENLLRATQLRGGIIGAVELVNCLTYRTAHQFVKDQDKHLNEPSWFEGPTMFGFQLANPVVLPFRRYPGWVRFFRVEAPAQPERK